MTATILRLALDYWQYALIGVGLLAAVGYVHERDQRIANEAIHAVTVERFVARDSAREVEAREHAARDSARADSIAHLAVLLDSAEARAASAEQGVREASRRAVEAGEDIRASIDSVAVLDPGLGRTMRGQLSEHLEADRETMAAVEEERRAARSVADRLRSQAGLLQRRFEDERELRLSTEDALDEARAALESAAAAGGGGFLEKLAWLAAVVSVGALAVSLVR